MAAIGGLIFTAVATYYSAAVAEDQLTQSREDSEREIREQAATVTVYLDSADPHDPLPQIHVVNRSHDPVSEAWVSLFMVPMDGGQEQTLLFNLDDLLPCTEAIFDGETVLRTFGVEDKKNRKVSEVWWGVNYLSFVDRDGMEWKRTSRGLSEWDHDKAPFDLLSGDMPYERQTAACTERTN
ncbi:hypothetical protein ACF063_05880 [Streptomyces chartreusis]|uniref:hypothetical protein n=1 Tax=Streptomyces chartreusis TaxID=1969 RepID=UPI0036F74E0D